MEEWTDGDLDVVYVCLVTGERVSPKQLVPIFARDVLGRVVLNVPTLVSGHR